MAKPKHQVITGYLTHGVQQNECVCGWQGEVWRSAPAGASSEARHHLSFDHYCPICLEGISDQDFDSAHFDGETPIHERCCKEHDAERS